MARFTHRFFLIFAMRAGFGAPLQTVITVIYAQDMRKNNFDPDGVGIRNGNYFGFTFTDKEALLHLLSVPWDVTSSYGGGSSSAPDAIIEESTQLDFYDMVSPGAWHKGIVTIGIDYSIQDQSVILRPDARRVMEILEGGGNMLEEKRLQRKVERVNNASRRINAKVYKEARNRLLAGKLVGLVGGDHSSPLGLIRAVGQKEKNIGILHLDAHADLREAYEGFKYSHASIMYNVLAEIPEVEKIVQVGVRDISSSEYNFALESGRVDVFDDYTLASRRFQGETWGRICEDIVSRLPEKVYVSFDVDVLSPENCLHTGTPVAGGLTFNEAVFLVDTIARSGRRIVGFDICEVAPGETNKLDAATGARLLFKLCGITLKSND